MGQTSLSFSLSQLNLDVRGLVLGRPGRLDTQVDHDLRGLDDGGLVVAQVSLELEQQTQRFEAYLLAYLQFWLVI